MGTNELHPQFVIVLLLESIQNDVTTNFIFVNIDEVTTINNTSWISLHLFVVQGWK